MVNQKNIGRPASSSQPFDLICPLAIARAAAVCSARTAASALARSSISSPRRVV
jgi:hypothetical protein